MPPRSKRGSNSVISIDQAWQSVSLEERLELISRAQASGLMATMATMFLIGCMAYGFDKIWLLVVGVAASSFVYPLFSSFSWRTEKPALILAYLAVRTVARRYAFAYNVPDLDIVFIYRAEIRELFRDKAAEELARQELDVEIDTPVEAYKTVWVVLMRGGVVFLWERPGGAKMEFLTHLTNESVLRKPTNNENPPDERALVLEGVAAIKGRALMITSRYPAAHYVFEKKVLALIEEQRALQETQERLRTQNQAA
jgi:hypothetical protein